MNPEIQSTILKGLVIGSIAFTGYEIARYCMSQQVLMSECASASTSLIGVADDLAISLEHLLEEQIA